MILGISSYINAKIQATTRNNGNFKYLFFITKRIDDEIYKLFTNLRFEAFSNFVEHMRFNDVPSRRRGIWVRTTSPNRKIRVRRGRACETRLSVAKERMTQSRSSNKPKC